MSGGEWAIPAAPERYFGVKILFSGKIIPSGTGVLALLWRVSVNWILNQASLAHVSFPALTKPD